MTERERGLLDLSALQLRAKPPEGASYPASFVIKIWRNRVSLTVFSGVKSLPRSGVFGVNLHPPMFNAFIEDFSAIVATPSDGSRVTRKMRVFDKATQDKQVVGELVYGKDQENIPYICVVNPSPDYPKIVFRLEPPRNYEIDGTDRATAATIYANGYLQFYRNTIHKLLIENFVDETKDKGNWGSKGTSGKSSSGSSFDDDDIPF